MNSKRKIPDSGELAEKSKGLQKLSSLFEGFQEPFVLSLACKSVVH